METKFTKFWKKYGPYLLFTTAIMQVVMFNDWSVGCLYFILGLSLLTDND